MVKSLRFLFQFIWVNLAIVLAFAAALTLGNVVTAGGQHASPYIGGQLAQYYELFPLMMVMIVFLLSFGFCTINLNMALSFGARRQDYFWAVQGSILLYALISWAVQLFMTALPAWLGWWNTTEWNLMMTLGGTPFWVYPLVCTTFSAAGCALGPLYAKSRIWSAIVISVFMVIGVGVVVLLLTVSNHITTGLWGDLPVILLAGDILILSLSEWAIWRAVHRAVVK